MLTQLHIKNIAVIQQATVSFKEGLNIFTGETGAGKTILISAIDAVLGERTSKDMIRFGEEKAQVTALFEEISPEALQTLNALGYNDDEGNVLISREIHLNGKSSCKINGVPATVAILKSIASLLIHIHGQRDSGQLLAPERHIELIDTFGATNVLLADYKEAYEKMCDIKKDLQSLQMDEAQKAQRIDMLTFQTEEILAAQLEDTEEEENLLAQRKLIKNSAQVREALMAAYGTFQGDEEFPGLGSQMDLFVSNVGQAAEYIADLGDAAQRVQEINYELTEYVHDIRTILDDFDFDPQQLNEIESRLDLLYKLKRKYGNSIEEILEFYQNTSRELETLSNSDKKIAALSDSLEKQTKAVMQAAERLSATRSKAAQSFLREVEEELTFLDMPSVKLSVKHDKIEPGPAGIDNFELYIVTNVGETPKPLSKIASGGEISRIMLAIKNVLAERDAVETLIFDEVDTGVSGRAAQKIGQKLGQVARSRQVICVTHLPQVAAFSDYHLYISKEVENGRTFTKIAPLDESGIIHELARIASGDMVTPTALESARELREHSKML